MDKESFHFYLTELKHSSYLSEDELAAVNFAADCFTYFQQDLRESDFATLRTIYDRVQKRKGYGTA